jgi:phage gp29-like protein
MQTFMGKGHLAPCKFVFEVDAPNTSTILAAAQAFYQLGGSIDEESLREALGLPSPEPGKPILSQQQMMSPQAAGTIPAGVPMQGPPGPDPSQQGLVSPDMQAAAAPPGMA